jgi:hypothetical protein
LRRQGHNRRFAQHEPVGDRIKDARALRDIGAAVAVGRAEAHTWATIGALLGTSGEAARQRYGSGADQPAHGGRRGGRKAARRSA